MKNGARVRRELAGVVVIVIVDGDAAFEQREQRRPVRIDGNVERRHGIASPRGDALEQRDVALDAGDERRVARRIEPQLKQRADAVGIAVERVEMAHAVPDPSGVAPKRGIAAHDDTGYAPSAISSESRRIAARASS